MTDADGRYRLDGLSKAAAYRLFIKTAKGLPYTNATLKVPAPSPGLEPITFDIAMKRGVVVRGKAIDKLTGRPIRVSVNYYAFADNLNAKEYAGFSESYDQHASCDEDGQYEVIALPGRGIIAVRDELGGYRPASGYEKIMGYHAKEKFFDTLPESLLPEVEAVIAEVVIDPKAESISLDLPADPGKSVAIEVVGPDGRRSAGRRRKAWASRSRRAPSPSHRPASRSTPSTRRRPRRVVVMHEGKKLIGTALVKGNEAGPVTIKLQPWGSVAGRIVDDEGRPRKAMFIGSPDGIQKSIPRPMTYYLAPTGTRASASATTVDFWSKAWSPASSIAPTPGPDRGLRRPVRERHRRSRRGQGSGRSESPAAQESRGVTVDPRVCQRGTFLNIAAG